MCQVTNSFYYPRNKKKKTTLLSQFSVHVCTTNYSQFLSIGWELKFDFVIAFLFICWKFLKKKINEKKNHIFFLIFTRFELTSIRKSIFKIFYPRLSSQFQNRTSPITPENQQLSLKM